MTEKLKIVPRLQFLARVVRKECQHLAIMQAVPLHLHRLQFNPNNPLGHHSGLRWNDVIVANGLSGFNA